MPFTFTTKEDRGGAFAEVTGYDGQAAELTLPESLSGLPVKSIAAFAFAERTDLTSVHLPKSLKSLHLFAFQNCVNLKEVELFNTTDDYYDGVIRGCRKLSKITVHLTLPENFIIAREILNDTDAALSFTFLPEDGEPFSLTFPEYVSEAREDTMARAIHFTIEGAGMAYRECVKKHAIDFREYDTLLPRLTMYDFASAASIALGRLQTPVDLTDDARKKYETFLTDHNKDLLSLLTKQKDTKAVQFLSDRGLILADAIPEALEIAAEKKLVEITGILMAVQGKKKETSGGGLSLSLSDW